MEEQKNEGFTAKWPLSMLVVFLICEIALGVFAKPLLCQNSGTFYAAGGIAILAIYLARYAMDVNRIVGGGFFSEAKDALVKNDGKGRAKVSALAPTMLMGAFLGLAKMFVFYVIPLVVGTIILGKVFYC